MSALELEKGKVPELRLAPSLPPALIQPARSLLLEPLKRLALVMLLPLLASASGLAQAPESPDSLVYILDDDQDLHRLFEEARKAASDERWNDTVDRYLEILETHTDQMVPWGPRTHSSAAAAARREMTALPEEARKVLVRRFEAERSKEVARATRGLDLAALERVADGPPVPAAAIALSRLASFAMERGDWGVGARYLNRLLDVFPEGAEGCSLAEVRARLAYCRTRAGDPPLVAPPGGPAIEALEGAGTTRIGGSETALPGFVRGLGDAQRLPDGTDWSTFGGNPAHSREALVNGHQLDLAWSHGLAGGRQDGPEADPRPLTSPEQEPNPVQPLFPVQSGGRIFVYNKWTACALDEATGKIEWQRMLAELGNPPPGSDRTYYYATAGEGAYVLLHEVIPDDYFGDASPMRRLVALSTEDGSTLWVQGPDPDAKSRETGEAEDEGETTAEPADESSKLLSTLRLTGPPVIAGGRVFSAGWQATEGDGEIKAYAVAFDLATGELVWSRFLCSSPSLGADRHTFPEGAFLAYAEGTLFCGTDIGVLSAIDPTDGEHLWCYRYERVPYRSRDNSRLIFSFLESWSDNPMIVQGGRLYATPGDSQFLHILLTTPDRESGLVQLARVAKARYRYLIGVRDRVVYLVGRDEAKRYHLVSAFRPEGGPRSNLWDFPIPNPTTEGKDKIDHPAGRAVLSGNRIYVPTYKGIYVLDADYGELLEQIRNPRGDGHLFGNLLSAGSDLISAYRLQVDCFRSRDG